MLATILIVSTLSLLLSCHVLCKKYRTGDTNSSEHSGTSRKVPYLKAQDTLDTCTVETRSISRKARNMEELVTLLAMRTRQSHNEEQDDA